MPSTTDSLLVQWGDRLFYPSNRMMASRTPVLTEAALRQRAQVLRQRIRATVQRRAPQVMVKVTGGGRGMGAIAAHLRYIAKAGRLPIEDDRGAVREGREALRAIADQWRFGGTRIPEVSDRREAFNIMLSMPAGTDARVLRQAAREFAKAALANHRYVMVLHTHQANPHVHISVRAEGRDGKRLNPRKEDLRRWREVFAERLRAWGIEAEATSQTVRGPRHREQRAWSRDVRGDSRSASAAKQRSPKMSPSHHRAGEAWARIAQALAASPEPGDRELSSAIVRYVRDMPVMREALAQFAAQRELSGMTRSHPIQATPTRRGPEIER
ncbi:MAG: relaxase/mobilization nuclease domain-containing protein [Pseudomonadota bacterium]